jgi:hypothetical protein
MKISHRRAACLRLNQTAICCELSVRALIALNFARGRFCRGCVFFAHLSAGPCHTNLQPCRLRLPIDQQVGGVNQGQHTTFAPLSYQKLTPAGPARGSHPTEITPGRPFVHVARRRRPAASSFLILPLHSRRENHFLFQSPLNRSLGWADDVSYHEIYQWLISSWRLLLSLLPLLRR